MAMAPLQTTYKERMDRFVVGMIPDMRTPGQDVSRAVETVDGIGFGVAVGQGTADRQVILSGTSEFVGVAVLDITQPKDVYAQYSMARIRTKGPVVVRAAVAVAAGDAAYAGAAGILTNVATGEPIGMFETTGAAGALVVLNLK